MNVLIIIPARGGSKGVPRKKITAWWGGKPLMAWSILTAKGSRYAAHCDVATEDGAIAEVARAWGARGDGAAGRAGG